MNKNMVSLICGEVKNSTKMLVALILVFPVLMQDSTIKDFVTGVAAAHPRIASTVAAITLLSALLHSPTLQAIMGIQQEEKTTTPDGATTEKTTTVVEQK